MMLLINRVISLNIQSLQGEILSLSLKVIKHEFWL